LEIVSSLLLVCCRLSSIRRQLCVAPARLPSLRDQRLAGMAMLIQVKFGLLVYSLSYESTSLLVFPLGQFSIYPHFLITVVMYMVKHTCDPIAWWSDLCKSIRNEMLLAINDVMLKFNADCWVTLLKYSKVIDGAAIWLQTSSNMYLYGYLAWFFIFFW